MADDLPLALPGFERLVVPDADRAGSQDFRAKEYTAVRIRRDYPGTYHAVARALFFYKLPVTTCADLFRMNSQCVAAIRDQVIAEASEGGAASFLVQSRRRSQREIVLARLVEAINERLSDDHALRDMSVDDLVGLLERLEKAPPARNGTDAQPAKPKPSVEDVTIVDAAAFDAELDALPCDGFSGDKKRAAEDAVPEVAQDGGNCSTGSKADD